MTIVDYKMLINGELVTGQGSFPVINPATEEVIATAPEVSEEQVQQALEGADIAFQNWSKLSLNDRRTIIMNYADVLSQHRDEIINLLILETGKPADNAEYDFDMLVNCLSFFLEEAARIDQPVIADPNGRFLNYVMRQPLGVVVGYLAWNFPLLNLGYKLGPVLAAGCTAIIKPSQVTPLATLKCAELLLEAGVPAGVVNVITGTDYDVTNPLLTSETASMFTMIGSTGAGVHAMKTACTDIKHFSVELGGNAPVVVYDDADIRAAAQNIIDLKFGNSGQVCVSPNRCFVHEDVYEEFLVEAVNHAAGLILSAGRKEGRLMGPMMTDKERRRVMALVDRAKDGGASIVCGGNIPSQPEKGFYLEPTILRDVNTSMDIAVDEIFGPVLPVLPYSSADDEIALANDTKYGLAAYVYTTNLQRGLRAAADIQAGSVCVNEVHYDVSLPHGGLKQSGVGKDCSQYSLEEYMTLKRVSVLVGS